MGPTTLSLLWLFTTLAQYGIVVQAADIVDGSCYYEKRAGSVFTAVPNYDQDSFGPDECKVACVAMNVEGLTLAGLQENKACICGKKAEATTGDMLAIAADKFCEISGCSASGDQSLCYGMRGRYVVYDVESSQRPSALTVVFDLDTEGVMKFPSIDYGGPPDQQLRLYIQTALKAKPSYFHRETPQTAALHVGVGIELENFPMGENVVSVLASDEDGMTTFIISTTFKKDAPSLPVAVSCPPVAATGVPFACGFATMGGGLNDMTVTYSEAWAVVDDPDFKTTPITYNNVIVTENLMRFGTPPPKANDLSLMEKYYETIEANQYILRGSRVNSMSRVLAASLWGNGDVVIEIVTPTCSSGAYDPMSGLCRTESDFAPESAFSITNGNTQTCAAESPFSSYMSQCTKADCGTADLCKIAPTEPIGSNTRSVIELATVGSAESTYQVLMGADYEEEDLIMYPGDMLLVKGPLFHEVRLDGVGVELGTDMKDTIDKAKPFIEVQVAKIDFVDIRYTCTVPNNAVKAEISDGSITAENATTTQCQDPIDGFEVECDTGTTTQLYEWGDEIYARTGEDVICTMVTTRGLPIHAIIDWQGDGTDVSDNDTRMDTEADARVVDFTHVYTVAGDFMLNLTALNGHSDPFFGYLKYSHNFSQMVHVEEAVFDFDMVFPTEFWIKEDGAITLEFVANGLYPTNPLLTCDWGECTSTDSEGACANAITPNKENANCSSAADAPCQILFTYPKHGEFTVTCTMDNYVSKQEFTHDITIYEKIVNFKGLPRFVSFGQDQQTGFPNMPLGDAGNMLPKDKNVTFLIEYDQGTIEELLFYNRTEDGEMENIMNYTIPDKFNASHARVSIPFPNEGFKNVTIVAKNFQEETEPYRMIFEIVGLISGLVLDDDNIITSMEETKWFSINFETFGSGACIVMTYSDGIVEAYGDMSYCAEWRPNVEYIPGIAMDLPIMVSHTYSAFGLFNVSAEASNVVTNATSTDFLNAIVTNAPCSPPKVSLPLTSALALEPMQYLRNDKIIVSSTASINCSGVLTTQKSWEIFKLDINMETNEETLTPLDIMELAPDWYDKPELAIEPRTLEYGVYKIIFTSRMWDEDDQDPNWTRKLPFTKSAFCYIEILASALIANFLEGGLSYITRGNKQYLNLEPYLWSQDPDYPDDKDAGMEFRFFCRRVTEDETTFQITSNETYNTVGTGDDEKTVYAFFPDVPLIRINDNRSTILEDLGGCFGTGHGPLDHSLGTLKLISNAFYKAPQVYEFMLEVRKGFRMSSKNILVKIEKGLAPIMKIMCAQPELCFPDDSGVVFVNPNIRMALTAMCSPEDNSNCATPLSYQWGVNDQDQALVSKDTMLPFLSSGSTGQDLVISVDFFTDGPDNAKEDFTVKLDSRNGDDVAAKNMMRLMVNKPPVNGTCAVTPTDGTFSVTPFQFTCLNWTDPEGKGVSKYSVAIQSTADESRPKIVLMQTTSFDPDNPIKLVFQTGIYKVFFTIEDVWGSKVEKEYEHEITVNMPPQEDLGAAFDPSAIAEMTGNGDTKALMMSLLTLASVIDDVPFLSAGGGEEGEVVVDVATEPISEEEAAANLAVAKGAFKTNALDAIVSSTGGHATDPLSASIMASTITSIIGEPAEDAALSDVGLEVVQKATGAYMNLVDSIGNLDTADPDVLVDVTNTVMGGLGTILQQTAATAQKDNDYENGEESGDGEESSGTSGACAGVKEVDLAAANTDVMEYDTVVSEGDDIIIPTNLDDLKCNGIIEAAKVAAGKLGDDITNMMADLSHNILSKLVVNEERRIANGPLNILSTLLDGPRLAVWQTVGTEPTKDVRFKFPSGWCLGELTMVYDKDDPDNLELANSTCNTPAGFTAISYDINPSCTVDTCDRIATDSKVIDIRATTRDFKMTEVSRVYDKFGENGILIDIPRSNLSLQSLAAPTYFNASYDSHRRVGPPVMMHQLEITTADVMIVIEYFPEELPEEIPTSSVIVLVDYERIPTLKRYQYGVTMGDDTDEIKWNNKGEFYRWDITEDRVLNRTGRWYMTVVNVTHYIPGSFFATRKPIKDFTPDLEVLPFSEGYYMRIWTTGCYYYNELTKAWQADGMAIRGAEYDRTECSTDHLTSFAAGFKIIPNKISFEYISAKNSFEDNVTIYVCIIITVALFLLTLIYARCQDLRDEKRLVTRSMVDNKREDNYMYEILTFTGMWKEASCDSKMYFLISGSRDETETRLLDPGWKDTLRRGTVDSYLMKTPRPLGTLNYIRVWHDNTGRGDMASWHCTSILIRDIQTNQRYEFILDDWLAVEKGDTQIEKLIPISGEAQKNSFRHQFTHNIEHKLCDHHLWMSIFLRSKRSRFTRCQRTGVCFALFYLIMLTNAMWYQSVPESIPEEPAHFGIFILSAGQMTIGIISCLMTLLPTLLMTFLFRHSKKRVLRKSRFVVANSKDHKHWRKEDRREEEYNRGHQSWDEDQPEVVHKNYDEPYVREAARQKKKFTIHWIFMYVAWFLVLACIALSAFFLISYAIQFGNDVTYQWLSSMIVSFFADLFFMESLKVLFISLAISCCCGQDLDDDDVDDDEEVAQITMEAEWYKESRSVNDISGFYPVDEMFLKRLRKARTEEVAMWNIVFELIAYVFFIVVVYIMSYGNRDPASFLLQNHMKETFVNRNGFHNLTTANGWWNWCHKTMVDDLRARNFYNGMPPYGLRGFIGDKTNRILGFPVLRQIRVKPNTCRVDQRVHNITQECAQASEITNEDKIDYCNAWEEQTALTENLPSCQRGEFKYATEEEMKGLTYSAFVDSYTGGGYVYKINKGISQTRADLRELQIQHWVNNHTRALFLEFSTYNANLNLFAIGTLVAEFIPGGGILPYTRFEVVRLIHLANFSGIMTQLAEGIFVLYIFYFMFVNFLAMKREGTAYWKQYWNMAEWAIILLALGAGFLYAYRYLLTQEILEIFAKTNGNGYMKLQEVGLIDSFYGYAVGLILFVANIKFVKLMRFNNTFEILLRTLSVCWEDLSGFLTVFALVYFAFVQVFYMILHVDLLEFHTLIATLETCFTMLLNKFKFGSIRQTSLTAAIMFFTFAISCSFILINVMLTIIMEAFETVSHELHGVGNKYEILDFCKLQTKLYIGVRLVPDTESCLRKDRHQNEFDTGEEEVLPDDDPEDNDSNTKELPNKVDQLLSRINDDYFDGELNLFSSSLKSQGMNFFSEGRKVDDSEEPIREESAPGHKKYRKKRIFNGDDPRGSSSRH